MRITLRINESYEPTPTYRGEVVTDRGHVVLSTPTHLSETTCRNALAKAVNQLRRSDLVDPLDIPTKRHRT